MTHSAAISKNCACSSAGGETHRIAACPCKTCMLASRSSELTGHLGASARTAARRASTGGQRRV
eukprot:2947467-Pleurochrysis_carterae.AAC.1